MTLKRARPPNGGRGLGWRPLPSKRDRVCSPGPAEKGWTGPRFYWNSGWPLLSHCLPEEETSPTGFSETFCREHPTSPGPPIPTRRGEQRAGTLIGEGFWLLPSKLPTPGLTSLVLFLLCLPGSAFTFKQGWAHVGPLKNGKIRPVGSPGRWL